MLDNYPFQGVLEVLFVRGHPNFQTYPCILGPKVLDFKGIFGAIMRKGLCYDFRRRVGAKHALAQRMLWTSLDCDWTRTDPPVNVVPLEPTDHQLLFRKKWTVVALFFFQNVST